MVNPNSIEPVQRQLPIEVSARCTLVGLEFVRNLRGCDAESVLACVGDATHPKFLRWVFNLAVDSQDARRRELRFWRDEVVGAADSRLTVAECVSRILGNRQTFPREELAIQWTINPMTVGRLIRAGEITEIGHRLTRASLAAFLKSRLQ